jgi:hypothetical protein
MQPVGLGYEKERQIESEERFGSKSMKSVSMGKIPVFVQGDVFVGGQEELEEKFCVCAKGTKSPSPKR